MSYIRRLNRDFFSADLLLRTWPYIGMFFAGLFSVAIGETARVFVSMEHNTSQLVYQQLPDYRGRLEGGL
jgi:hypothetical protein